ncbi:MAG: hypothetical protein LBN07_00320 [Christensenellaceae bacterium]|nr:hypothetical protein [Christensenellaceae bacterium]
MKKNDFKKGEFIAIYTDVEGEDWALGEVIAVDDEDVIISSVHPLGLDDGLALYNISIIRKIEKETQYNTKIQKIMKAKNTCLARYNFKSKKILLELLALAKDTKKIISVELQNEESDYEPYGLVESFDDVTCTIKLIDMFGRKDGVSIFSIEDISAIMYNSLKSRDILWLMENQ